MGSAGGFLYYRYVGCTTGTCAVTSSLWLSTGFGCILGGIVSGKVVEMYTQNGITDWQTVWLIFAGYSVVLAFAFMAMFKYKHVRVPTGTQTVSH